MVTVFNPLISSFGMKYSFTVQISYIFSRLPFLQPLSVIRGDVNQMRKRGIVRSWVWGILIMLLVTAILPSCFGAGTPVQPVQNQVVIFSGQIPYGEGNVSIRSDSGTLYQIPAMTPLGIIQALAGTGMISRYRVGEELYNKRGIFTLDGVNSYEVTGQDAWFVLVNGVQLREYLLPSHEGLNTYLLKDGDDVLFAYGDPTMPAIAAKALIWVQVGSKNGVMQFISPSAMMGQYMISQIPMVSTPAPTVVSTPVPVVESTVVSTPAPTVVPPASPVVESPVNTTPVPTVVPTTAPVVESTVVSTPAPTVVPPASPVVESPVNTTPVPTVVPTTAPVVEPTPEPTPVPSEDMVHDTTNLTNASVQVEGLPEPSPTAQKPEDNRMLYSGVFALPEGTVNVTVSSGIDYEIPVNTPLGVLHMLLKDSKITNLCIDDRGMHKGGILILEGINEYFNTATKIWFVRVNGTLLEDYANPKTDGLNKFLLMAGDTVSYYYGDPAGSLQDAEAMIVVTLG